MAVELETHSEHEASERFSFGIEGMHCAGCAGRVEKGLLSLKGVQTVRVNLAAEKADVAAVAEQVNEAQLRRAVASLGYTATFGEEGEAVKSKTRYWEAVELSISALLTLPLVVPMFAMWLGLHLHLPPLWQLALASPVQFYIARRFYKGAYSSLKSGVANMNMDVLVALGTSAAFGFSLYAMMRFPDMGRGHLYFEASAVVITLVLAGKFLEARAKEGTTSAIRKLMELRPETARIHRDGGEIEVPIEEVSLGDITVVRPGERVPVDGIVRDGRSELDEALITGESLPVAKTIGDTVTGGAVNGDGVLKVEATAIGADATLSKIISLVDRAQSGKAPVQKLVDRVCAVFVPTVLVIAGAAFVGWLLVGGGFEQALIAAVSVLVIACPCALGLATPAAIVTGTGAAARHGILIKDVEAIEAAKSVTDIMFDKTGTLTLGKPKVIALEGDDGFDRALTIRRAASLQVGSEHPLAKAFVAFAEAEGVDLSEPSTFKNLPGSGVTGQVEDQSVIIGNAEFFQSRGLGLPQTLQAIAERYEQEGATVVWIGVEERAVGIAALADQARAEAASAIARLREMGVSSAMLTGDGDGAARSVADAIGLERWTASVKPDQKVLAVTQAREGGAVVAMVGDGINDAPALAAADIGIAMGTGTDIAMDAAGVTLMRPDPRLAGAVIDVSRAIWRKIKQNLFWAFAFNAIGVPLAAFGYLSPEIAGAAMALSSVAVVSNALLLRAWSPRLGDVR